MFTDVYFTNLSLPFRQSAIVFFKKNTDLENDFQRPYKIIQECQYGWTSKIRFFWDLRFRLVKASANVTQPYALKTTYGFEKTKYLLWKEGTITLQQNFLNGKQIIDFKQIKGNFFSGVQIYRGTHLLVEKTFFQNQLLFEIDTIFSIAEMYYNTKGEISTATNKSKLVLDFDLIGIKKINFQKTPLNELIVSKTELW